MTIDQEIAWARRKLKELKGGIKQIDQNAYINTVQHWGRRRHLIQEKLKMEDRIRRLDGYLKWLKERRA